MHILWHRKKHKGFKKPSHYRHHLLPRIATGNLIVRRRVVLDCMRGYTSGGVAL